MKYVRQRRKILYDTMYMWNQQNTKKKKTPLLNITKKADTDIENKLVVINGEREVGGAIKWLGSKRYKLLCIK